MTLAARLLLAFGLVAVFASGAVGLSVREASRAAMEAEFHARIGSAAKGMRLELGHEALALRDLLDPLCEHDTIVDRALLELEIAKGQLSAFNPEYRMNLPHLVAVQAEALKVDELFLVTGDGTVLGTARRDAGSLGKQDARFAAAIQRPPKAPPSLRTSADGRPAMEVHCAKSSTGVVPVSVGLVAARQIDRVLERVGETYGVGLRVASPGSPALTNHIVIERAFDVPEVAGLSVVASVARSPLLKALGELDRNLMISGAAALLLALSSAVLLARSLSRPIVALAQEAREVVSGQPKTVAGKGGRELAELAGSFNRAIAELTSMRKRLAATERIAAQREVARQIAHEIKNPLAPIRAAVETLRRLKDRDDPAFDEYFEEATVTVLGEVHRIANIVTQFTKFARMPPPRPESLDLAAVARGVVSLHAMAPDSGPGSGKPRVELQAEELPPVVADKDQIVQVLTNLVQNGLDAAAAVRPDPRVVVSLGRVGADRVRIVVRDNGPGVPDDWLPRLFEPYATTKEKGTGLGLAIVQRIVFEHGGEIAYRTATKGGAVFELLLPLAGPPALELDRHDADRTGPRG